MFWKFQTFQQEVNIENTYMHQFLQKTFQGVRSSCISGQTDKFINHEEDWHIGLKNILKTG